MISRGKHLSVAEASRMIHRGDFLFFVPILTKGEFNTESKLVVWRWTRIIASHLSYSEKKLVDDVVCYRNDVKSVYLSVSYKGKLREERCSLGVSPSTTPDRRVLDDLSPDGDVRMGRFYSSFFICWSTINIYPPWPIIWTGILLPLPFVTRGKEELSPRYRERSCHLRVTHRPLRWYYSWVRLRTPTPRVLVSVWGLGPPSSSLVGSRCTWQNVKGVEK